MVFSTEDFTPHICALGCFWRKTASYFHFLYLTLIDHAAGDETVSHIEYRRLTARKRARRGGKTHLGSAVRVKRDVRGNAGRLISVLDGKVVLGGLGGGLDA